MSTNATLGDPYQELLNRTREARLLQSTGQLLEWDQDIPKFDVMHREVLKAKRALAHV